MVSRLFVSCYNVCIQSIIGIQRRLLIKHCHFLRACGNSIRNLLSIPFLRILGVEIFRPNKDLRVDGPPVDVNRMGPNSAWSSSQSGEVASSIFEHSGVTEFRRWAMATTTIRRCSATRRQSRSREVQFRCMAGATSSKAESSDGGRRCGGCRGARRFEGWKLQCRIESCKTFLEQFRK